MVSKCFCSIDSTRNKYRKYFDEDARWHFVTTKTEF